MSLLANVTRYMLTGVATTIVVGKCVTEPLSFKKEFDEIQKARAEILSPIASIVSGSGPIKMIPS